QLEYVLMRDDSQQDPHLYERICKVFPKNIKAVYIRQTSRRKKSSTIKVLANLEDMGVATCYFSESGKAIAHSKKIGIV
ncbi:MAG: phosphatase domain-containing protein, partial [Salinimicrobium sp.]